jgi:proteasome lid subunit RPN8/RPN11
MIDRAASELLVAHARLAAPRECCGLLGHGHDGATLVQPLENKAPGEHAFEVDPDEVMEVIAGFEARGGELTAVYHSHVGCAPEPSEIDMLHAADWPGLVWVIVGLPSIHGASPVLAAWWIEAGSASPAWEL